MKSVSFSEEDWEDIQVALNAALDTETSSFWIHRFGDLYSRLCYQLEAPTPDIESATTQDTPQSH